MPRSASLPPVYEFHAGADQRWLLLCDHASNRLPSELGELGLAPAERQRHISYDIGAGGVARQLARHLHAPVILHRYSRLTVDPNRSELDPTLILDCSDGTVVPGNVGLDPREYRRRIVRYHQPYHRAITRHLDRMRRCAIFPTLVSIHSFTPRLDGVPRPWPVGLLWRDDPALAHRLIRELAADGTHVGDNQPYDGHIALGHSLQLHGIERGLPHLLIELRQDLLLTPGARARWALKLYRALRRVCGV